MQYLLKLQFHSATVKMSKRQQQLSLWRDWKVSGSKKICWIHGDGEMDINGVCILWIQEKVGWLEF